MILSKKQKKVSANGLAILRALAAAGGDQDWVTAPAVARDARNRGQEINAPTVYRVLSRIRVEVEYRTVGRIRRFHLKRAGKVLLESRLPDGSIFVSPGTPWSTQWQLRSFLKDHASKFLLVVDPYVSEETLDILSDVTVPIQILTSQLGRRGKQDGFIRTFKKFKCEKKGLVELRQCSPTDLHGRYLFTDVRGWVVDHSLQDLGTKPALILPLHIGAVFGDVCSHFTNLFQKGTPII